MYINPMLDQHDNHSSAHVSASVSPAASPSIVNVIVALNAATATQRPLLSSTTPPHPATAWVLRRRTPIAGCEVALIDL